MTALRNIVLFTCRGGRLAIDLRWVGEIVTLGPITRVPKAPACIAGVTNVRGAVLPVVGTLPQALFTGPSATVTPSHVGEGAPALVLEALEARAALPIDCVEAVTTLPVSHQHGDHVRFEDEDIQLLDIEAIFRELQRAVAATATAALARSPGAGKSPTGPSGS